MANGLRTDDAEMYAQATIAAILTLGALPPAWQGGNDPQSIVQRYKEVLDQLRKENAWERRGADTNLAEP